MVLLPPDVLPTCVQLVVPPMLCWIRYPVAPLDPVQVRLIWLDEIALATRLIGAAGATVIPDFVAENCAMVSVTLSDCVPAVPNVNAKACTPRSAFVNV